jgi:hypothetical protein
MLEEIKKEIRATCMIYLITPHPNVSKPDNRNEEEIREDVASTLKLIDKILDKYNIPQEILEQQKNNLDELIRNHNKLVDYKSAWEELRHSIINPSSYSSLDIAGNVILRTYEDLTSNVQEIQEKYHLGE